MEIEYGDTFMCEIETVGDTDVFHFSGQVGDTIAAGVSEVDGFNFEPCITLTAPNGETTDGCNVDNALTRIDATLA